MFSSVVTDEIIRYTTAEKLESKSIRGEFSLSHFSSNTQHDAAAAYFEQIKEYIPA